MDNQRPMENPPDVINATAVRQAPDAALANGHASNAPATRDDAPVILTGDSWMDQGHFRYMFSLAKTFAGSDMVPAHFKNKPNDVLIVLQMAVRLRVDPMGALQNIYVYKGKPGMHAPFAISLANRSGVFASRIRFKYEGEGEKLAVTATAKLADTGEDVSRTVTYATAILEGWVSNAKYKSMPEQMLSYRAAMMLIRLYAPEVTNGMATIDDLETVDVTPRAGATDAQAAPTADVEKLLARVRHA